VADRNLPRERERASLMQGMISSPLSEVAFLYMTA
jgi:hypothetical protein